MFVKDIAALILKLKSNSKKLVKIQILSDFIISNDSKQSMLFFDMLSGTYQREISKKDLGISLKTILQSLSSYYNIPISKLEKEFYSHGDMIQLINSFDKEQKGFITFDQELSIKDIINVFEKISKTSGKNSSSFKKDSLISLFAKTKSKEERIFLALFLSDTLKIGVNEGILIEAFLFSYFPKIYDIHYNSKKSWYISEEILNSIDKKIIHQADKEIEYNSLEEIKLVLINNTFPFSNLVLLTGITDLPRDTQKYLKSLVEKVYAFNVSFQTTYDLLKKSSKNIFNPPIVFNKPIQVMLGPRLYSFNEIEEKIKFPVFVDYKYDGLRLIIQNQFGDVKLFSRNLENLTSQFPEVIEFIKSNFSNVSCVIDCECVGFSKQFETQIPFQELSKRIMTKSHNLKTNSIIGFKAFDILEYNGELYYEKSLIKRQEKLKSLFLNNKIKVKKDFQKEKVIEKLNLFFK